MINTTGNFEARLGHKTHPGFLSQDERVAGMPSGRNPFATDAELPENSPLFFGRTQVLYEILSTLRHPDNPRCVSLLGERRIGKSSLLNQVFAALGQEERLLAVRGTTQDWSQVTPARFFLDLRQAIREAVEEEGSEQDADAAESQVVYQSLDGSGAVDPAVDYAEFLAFLQRRVGRRYRLVLILDGFETLVGNAAFDTEFFTKLRELASSRDFRIGFLVASRAPLSRLRNHHESLNASSFWDLFGFAHVLGPLQPEEALAAMQAPWARTLDGAVLPPEVIEEIEKQAGHHPGLFRMVLADRWEAHKSGRGPDTGGMEQELTGYFRAIWEDRAQEEKELLVRILAEKPIGQHMLLRDLRSRGLIVRKDDKDRLFTALFEAFVRELLPEDPALSQILAEKTEKEKDGGDAPPRKKKLLDFLFRRGGKR
uniref:AAA ATPase domain-containing protein n=1 Tax=Candidatus Kentrum sp. DK TaxID=2126562 RepID=A0A450S3X8_9GAMM|nr:MAG: AAA ATPase domain-containing protein [Candidatus Kentron sp. DK]